MRKNNKVYDFSKDLPFENGEQLLAAVKKVCDELNRKHKRRSK